MTARETRADAIRTEEERAASTEEKRGVSTEEERGVNMKKERVMSEKARAELDFRQNITIAALSVLAVFLFSRTELFDLGWKMLAADFPAVTVQAATTAQDAASGVLTVPVRFAATGVYGGVYGRYVSVTMNTGASDFRPARWMFGDALQDTDDFDEISQEDFLSSVRGTSLYCDFLYPLPLSALAGLLDAVCTDERPVRSLALTRTENGVSLCLWDGAGAYFRRAASVSRAELDETTGRYELGNGVFASDLSDTDADYRAVAPLSLFPDPLPVLPAYSAVSGLSDTDRLLTALRFNPLTRSRYTEANGTEVIMEGGRSIRVRLNGSVYYQDSGRGGLAIDCAGEVPTGWEAVRECAGLLNGVLVPQGCAPVYPLEVQRREQTIVLRFGYALNGVPVFYADGGAAAVVTLTRNNIDSLELRPRRYARADTETLLLPLSQALGLASLHPGAELCLGYEDSGGSRLNGQWFSSDALPARTDEA